MADSNIHEEYSTIEYTQLKNHYLIIESRRYGSWNGNAKPRIATGCKDETVQKKVLEWLYSEFSQLRKKREAIQVYKKQTFYFLLVQVMRPCSLSLTYNTKQGRPSYYYLLVLNSS